MIDTRTTDDGRHVSLHQLIPNRFSQHCSERRVEDPNRVRSQTSIGALSQKRRTPSRRQGSAALSRRESGKAEQHQQPSRREATCAATSLGSLATIVVAVSRLGCGRVATTINTPAVISAIPHHLNRRGSRLASSAITRLP